MFEDITVQQMDSRVLNVGDGATSNSDYISGVKARSFLQKSYSRLLKVRHFHIDHLSTQGRRFSVAQILPVVDDFERLFRQPEKARFVADFPPESIECTVGRDFSVKFGLIDVKVC